MSRLIVLVSLASILAAGAPARAQQPYAGLEVRPIKALSEQQTADLRAGRGMGLALASSMDIPDRCTCSNWRTPWACPINSARRFRIYSPP